MTTSDGVRETAHRSGGAARTWWGLLLRLWGIFGLASLAGGCASYSGSVEEAKADVVRGDPDRGVEKLNEVLGVRKDYEIPNELDGENTLVLLERAVLMQALGNYEVAARDMMLADQKLDWLDIAAQGKAKIGKYIYSGSSTRYRAPPYERFLLNTMNMINFLALRDWEGAQVEARRFGILEEFFLDKQQSNVLEGAVGFGNYLGGVAFEASGDYQNAARRYVKAWHYGTRTSRLRERTVALCSMIGYKPSELVDLDDLSELDEAVSSADPPSFSEYRNNYVDGELIVLVQTGLVPYKVPKRYPLLRALEYSESRGAYAGSVALSAEERRRARELAVSGALKWVNFPALSEKGLPSARSVSLEIDDGSTAFGSVIDVDRQVEHAWRQMSGALMAAAISRTLVRAVAGTATREAVQSSNAEGAGLLGVFAQIAVEGGMAAADRPDTRSWSLLPGKVRLRRLDVSPGQHQVGVRVDGSRQTKTAEVGRSGPTLVNFSRYR